MSEFKTRLHSVPSGGFLTDRDKDKKPILDVRELGIDFGGRGVIKILRKSTQAIKVYKHTPE